MSSSRIRVGIVGLQPGRSWASSAHLPALRHLSSDFEVVGVANSSLERAQAAAKACHIPRAFQDIHNLATSPDIDLIAVTVKVPAHYKLVEEVLKAGKHVYCEWPLVRTLEEATALAVLARKQGVHAITGTQSRVTPAIPTLKKLVAESALGEIISTSVSGWARIWGPTISDVKHEAYLLKRDNGATMLTIPFAHTIAALIEVLGDIKEVSAVLDTRYKRVQCTENGQWVNSDAPDQIVIAGYLGNGAPLAMHYQGGEPKGIEGFVWDLHGSEGDIRVTGPTGHIQIVPLAIKAGRKNDARLEDVLIENDGLGLDDLVAGNVARIYKRLASDIRNDTATAPTFDDAVTLHHVLAAIERSAEQRIVVGIDTVSRFLPEVIQ